MASADHAPYEQLARRYLAAQLGPRAPQNVALLATFDERPLEDEGSVALFAFDLPPDPAVRAALAGAWNPRHYVVVGETEPTYFPAYDLGPDDAYSFHVGTRFILQVGVSVADPDQEPEGSRERMRSFVAACNPGVSIDHESLAGLFRCADRFFAAYRICLRGQDVYCMGADCPPGFYQLTAHPPQVALTLHLGQLIRAEARQELARVVATSLRPTRGRP